MSMFGFGQKQISSEEKIAMVENEISTMMNLQNRLVKICTKKCVPNDYREGELNKGESVCLDRCANKFLDAWMKTSEIMMQIQQNQMAGGGGGGGGGFPQM